MTLHLLRPPGGDGLNVHSPNSRNAAGSTSMRLRLRHETRKSHAALDATFAPMLETADYPSYRRFIRVSHACHAAIEARLDAGPLACLIADWRERSRMPALEADRRAMGIAPLCVPDFELRPDDRAGAFGAAYVLEGSRIGAKFIARRMREAAAAAQWPGSSFAFVSAETAHRFQDFTIVLDEQNFDEIEIASCCAAADRAFRLFADAARLASARTAAETGPA